MKIKTITLARGYKLSRDYQGVESRIEATADVEDGESEGEAYDALKKRVLGWLAEDYRGGKKLLSGIAADIKN